MRAKITTPALQDMQSGSASARGPGFFASAVFTNVPRSMLLDNEDDECPDSSSEPCMSASKIRKFAESGSRDFESVTIERQMRDLKQMTVAILLPKCKSLNRSQGKVILLRVRTKKESSNLSTTIKRNITAANAHFLLKACEQNESEKLDEAFDDLMSNDDIQPIRKGGCCEAVGNRAIEDAVRHNNVYMLKKLLHVLHPLRDMKS